MDAGPEIRIILLFLLMSPSHPTSGVLESKILAEWCVISISFQFISNSEKTLKDQDELGVVMMG